MVMMVVGGFGVASGNGHILCSQATHLPRGTFSAAINLPWLFAESLPPSAVGRGLSHGSSVTFITDVSEELRPGRECFSADGTSV
jgi:hypothetical protein